MSIPAKKTARKADVAKMIAFVVINEELYVLCMKDPRHQLDAPGGKAEHGETGMQALAREVEEELGMDLSLVHILRSDKFTFDDGRIWTLSLGHLPHLPYMRLSPEHGSVHLLSWDKFFTRWTTRVKTNQPFCQWLVSRGAEWRTVATECAAQQWKYPPQTWRLDAANQTPPPQPSAEVQKLIDRLEVQRISSLARPPPCPPPAKWWTPADSAHWNQLLAKLHVGPISRATS